MLADTLEGLVSSLPGAPVLGNLSASRNPTTLGDDVTLAVDQVTGLDNTTEHGVSFYRDANRDGQVSDDEYLGTDWNTPEGPSGQYQVTASTTNWPVGPSNILVFAFNSSGPGSIAKVLSVSVQANQPPEIGSLLAPAAVTKGNSVTLTAQQVSDDEAVSGVSFYLDSNGNGTLDGGDQVLGTGTQSGVNWGLTVGTGSWPLGANRVFARAIDNRGAQGPAVAASLAIGKRAPVIGALVAPGTVVQGDRFALTANNVSAPDGAVTGVAFFLDANFNGVLDAGDTALGDGARNGSAWSSAVSAVGWAPGAVRLFARASDDSSPAVISSGTTILTVLQANAAPILAPLANQTVRIGGSLTFVANAIDSDAGQALRFSLAPGAPQGSAIDPATGAFSWTPTQSQGPWTYSFTVRVTDNGSPSLTAEATFSVDVTTTPVAPTWLAAVTGALTHSDESYGQFVTAAYQTYLGRLPGGAELGGWVSAMRGGLSDERLEAGFIGSPEYVANHGGAGAGWVRGMYRDLLGRAPSQAEVDGWVAALNAGASPQQVAYGFAASSERERQRVTGDYRQFLGRDPSPAEVDGWVGAFASGLASNEDVVAGFVGSDEFFQAHGGNAQWFATGFQELFGHPASQASSPPTWLAAASGALTHSDESYGQFVTAAYQKYLGRLPGGAELNGWVSAMRGGLSDERLEAGFIGSPEYVASHGGAGAGWVRGMYRDLLGRAPSQAEVDGWVNALNGGVTPAQVAYGFAAGREREGQRVTADYLQFLGRAPSQAEVDGWVGAFASGLASNEDVVAGFVGSDEFFHKHGDNPQDWENQVLLALFGPGNF